MPTMLAPTDSERYLPPCSKVNCRLSRLGMVGMRTSSSTLSWHIVTARNKSSARSLVSAMVAVKTPGL